MANNSDQSDYQGEDRSHNSRGRRPYRPFGRNGGEARGNNDSRGNSSDQSRSFNRDRSQSTAGRRWKDSGSSDRNARDNDGRRAGYGDSHRGDSRSEDRRSYGRQPRDNNRFSSDDRERSWSSKPRFNRNGQDGDNRGSSWGGRASGGRSSDDRRGSWGNRSGQGRNGDRSWNRSGENQRGEGTGSWGGRSEQGRSGEERGNWNRSRDDRNGARGTWGSRDGVKRDGNHGSWNNRENDNKSQSRGGWGNRNTRDDRSNRENWEDYGARGDRNRGGWSRSSERREDGQRDRRTFSDDRRNNRNSFDSGAHTRDGGFANRQGGFNGDRRDRGDGFRGQRDSRSNFGERRNTRENFSGRDGHSSFGGRRDGGRFGSREQSFEDDREFRQQPHWVAQRREQAANEPAVDLENFDPKTLPGSVRAELRGLPKDLAREVMAHLAAAGEAIEEDPELAVSHAQAARRRAARMPIVREAVAETTYAAGDFATALTEYRAVARMTGENDYLPVIADCERAVGKREQALRTIKQGHQANLDEAQKVELILVEAGLRDDMGQRSEALRLLRKAISDKLGTKESQARLRYSYGNLLELEGEKNQAIQAFQSALKLDEERELDADERLRSLGEDVPELEPDFDEEDYLLIEEEAGDILEESDAEETHDEVETEPGPDSDMEAGGQEASDETDRPKDASEEVTDEAENTTESGDGIASNSAKSDVSGVDSSTGNVE